MLEPIAMVMRRRRLEWSGNKKRIHETEKITAVPEINWMGSALEEEPG